MLGLVRLDGVTQIHHLKRKDQLGHVEYWKAGCGESRMSGVDGGKEHKLLPIRTKWHVFRSFQVGVSKEKIRHSLYTPLSSYGELG